METARLPQSRIYELTRTWVSSVVRQSYALADYHREPTAAELGAHRGLMMCRRLEPINVVILMSYIEPAATLRQDDDRRDGDRGASALPALLELANTGLAAPDELMALVALAKPFTAGNGLCARALWLWRALQGTEREVAAYRSASNPFQPSVRTAGPRAAAWN